MRPAMARLLLALLPLLPLAAAKERCSSGMKGDFAFKTCASFCKSARASSHCKFCKCQECAFCGASSAGGASPTSPAKASDKPQGSVSYSLGALPQRPTPASSPVLQEPSSPSSVGVSTTPVSATGEKIAHKSGRLLPASIGLALLLALVCYALAVSRSKPRKGIAIGEEIDEELLPYEDIKQGGAQAAEVGLTPASTSEDSVDAVHRRMRCVGFLCVQYSAYALLRRYATGILHEGWSFSSVLGVGEAIKFAISFYMIANRPDGSDSPVGPLQEPAVIRSMSTSLCTI